MIEKKENGKLINNLTNQGFLNYGASVFAQIKIAEEVIKEYKEDCPLVDRCFLAFHSEFIEPDFAPWIFHSHCKEIADRLKKVGKRWSKRQIFDLMQPPTKAEIVCALSKASMLAPLRRDISALALYYFDKVAKEEGKEFEIDHIPVSDLELKQVEEEVVCHLSKPGKARAKIVWRNL